jgi:hypothetical protein
MSTPSGDQLPRTARARTTFRVVGVVLLLAGLVIGGIGVSQFIADFESMEGGPTPILVMAAGGFLCIFGLGALNAGTIGAQSRYVAGETMPTVKRSAEYLSDGQGIMGVGRTVDDGTGAGPQQASGPFCRSCGTRNDEDARFCDGCGASMA